MKCGLTEASLAEVCSLVTDGTHDTPKRVPSGFPLIKAKEIAAGQIDFSSCDQISETEHRKIIARSKPELGDTLFTHIGASLGAAAYVNTRREFSIKNIALFKPNPAFIDARYLYYIVLSPEFQSLAIATKTGSAQPFLGLSQLRSHRINYHRDLPIQRRIAGILATYDELIENSQRRIKILEAMARALYREALGTDKNSATSRPIVDVPYWRLISENVGKYAGAKRYYATADIEGLAVTGPGIDYSFSDKPSRAQKQPIPNSVWFARMKETYKIAWYGPVDDERVSGVILSSGFAGFEARDPELWPLLFLTISSHEFHVQKDLYCTGATQMSLTNEGLARIMLPLPDAQAARRLGRDTAPMLNAIAGLQRRNENLRLTRDLLLLRLLSGQIDVEAMLS
jgi:type I restriction enzyme S subunit